MGRLVLLALEVVGSFLLLVAVVGVGHHLVLAAVALLRPTHASAPSTLNASSRFLILIPAHDESDTIGAALQSCQAVEYPPDRFEICVIADNCSDETAAVARSHGVTCLERTDPTRHGKGAALRWATEQLRDHSDWDACLILDADCVIDHRSLQVFNDLLESGAKVLQCRYAASNPDESAISYTLALGNCLENDFYYRAKGVLGSAVLLRGTGMVFSRRVLESHRWSADSLVEDQALSIELVRAGYLIRYVPEIDVLSPFPATIQQLRVQRGRWARGHVELSRRSILSSTFTLDPRRIDLALTVLLQSRAFHLGLIASLLGYAGICLWLTGATHFELLLVVGGLLLLGYTGYVGAGILKLGLTRHRLRLLAQLPGVAIQVVRIAATGLRGGPAVWSRTPRS